jgi:hypothetical protein
MVVGLNGRHGRLVSSLNVVIKWKNVKDYVITLLPKQQEIIVVEKMRKKSLVVKGFLRNVKRVRLDLLSYRGAWVYRLPQLVCNLLIINDVMFRSFITRLYSFFIPIPV